MGVKVMVAPPPSSKKALPLLLPGRVKSAMAAVGCHHVQLVLPSGAARKLFVTLSLLAGVASPAFTMLKAGKPPAGATIVMRSMSAVLVRVMRTPATVKP